ncbi:hypothetical protein ECG_03054 [Echinococcus granulosus]|uniref:Uncharacterized protein n=1 Tax=Echinococcus granulosus TaxID=6210 RepID=A0A068WNC8_ECHGR|nr:hypothetical protein ECG_03054 [Echinococcus granulosus]CDS19978.1 hypothetical protein EgrG_000216300 [Echinococcus granulosus]
MLASSSSDDELDDRQQPPPSAPTTHVTGCGGVGRGHRAIGSRAAPGAHPTAPGQIIRKSQSPLQQQQASQPNGARRSQTRHQIFSPASSRSSVRSNDACDNTKHRHHSPVAAQTWYRLFHSQWKNQRSLDFRNLPLFILLFKNDKIPSVACIGVLLRFFFMQNASNLRPRLK